MSTKRKYQSEYDDDIIKAVGSSLSISAKKQKPPGNGLTMKELAYDAMYRDNVRLQEELMKEKNKTFLLEDQLRKLKHEFDELSGRHTFLCREVEHNNTPKGLYPTHALMYTSNQTMAVDSI